MYAPMNRGLCLDLGVGAVGGGQKATQQAHGWRLHDASGGPQGVAARDGEGEESGEGGRGGPRGGGEYLASVCAAAAARREQKGDPAADAPVGGGVDPEREQQLPRNRTAGGGVEGFGGSLEWTIEGHRPS